MIIDRLKNILKNDPEKTSLIYRKEGHLTIKNYEETFNDMFRMISFLSRKGVKSGDNILFEASNTYSSVLFLLAALYKNYNIYFYNDKSELSLFENVNFDYIVFNNIKDLFSNKVKCKRKIYLNNYIYGYLVETNFGDCNNSSFTFIKDNKVVKVYDSNMVEYYTKLIQQYREDKFSYCMICDNIIDVLFNVLCGVPTYISKETPNILNAVLNKLNVVKASINSCKLSYFYLLKIHDRKGLIRSVYLDKPVSEELKKNFRNAHFFIFEDKLF